MYNGNHKQKLHDNNKQYNNPIYNKQRINKNPDYALHESQGYFLGRYMPVIQVWQREASFAFYNAYKNMKTWIKPAKNSSKSEIQNIKIQTNMTLGSKNYTSNFQKSTLHVDIVENNLVKKFPFEVFGISYTKRGKKCDVKSYIKNVALRIFTGLYGCGTNLFKKSVITTKELFNDAQNLINKAFLFPLKIKGCFKSAFVSQNPLDFLNVCLINIWKMTTEYVTDIKNILIKFTESITTNYNNTNILSNTFSCAKNMMLETLNRMDNRVEFGVCKNVTVCMKMERNQTYGHKEKTHASYKKKQKGK